jgi:hypothetical protein
VVDVQFPPLLPLRHHCLHTDRNDAVILEIRTHRDPDTMRCVALSTIRGLGRNMLVLDTGQELNIPASEARLGLTLNMFSDPIDGAAASSTSAISPHLQRSSLNWNGASHAPRAMKKIAQLGSGFAWLSCWLDYRHPHRNRNCARATDRPAMAHTDFLDAHVFNPGCNARLLQCLVLVQAGERP